MDILIGWSDFSQSFLPAARDVWRGVDPYSGNPNFFAVPWALYLILPLAPLPEILASLIWLGLGILASLGAIALLVAPYARNYDYNLALLPALYLIRQRFATTATVGLLLWPLGRLFIGDITWSWADIIVPLGLLALLVLEGRRAQVGPSEG